MLNKKPRKSKWDSIIILQLPWLIVMSLFRGQTEQEEYFSCVARHQ